ncbi:MAG: polymer-forming cytoskeletal protein [Alphaproteobacteria bacterium]
MPEPAQPQQQVRRAPPRTAAPSIISADMTVVGTVSATGDIQVDGKIEGDIFSTSLTVGEKAVVNGEVRADEVTIRGHLVGGLRARKINLASTCHVEGDIIHNALSVETGAFFQGNIRHSDDPLTEGHGENRTATSPSVKGAQPNGGRHVRQTFAQFNQSQQSGDDAGADDGAGSATTSKAVNGSGSAAASAGSPNQQQRPASAPQSGKGRPQQPNRNG